MPVQTGALAAHTLPPTPIRERCSATGGTQVSYLRFRPPGPELARSSLQRQALSRISPQPPPRPRRSPPPLALPGADDCRPRRPREAASAWSKRRLRNSSPLDPHASLRSLGTHTCRDPSEVHSSARFGSPYFRALLFYRPQPPAAPPPAVEPDPEPVPDPAQPTADPEPTDDEDDPSSSSNGRPDPPGATNRPDKPKG